MQRARHCSGFYKYVLISYSGWLCRGTLTLSQKSPWRPVLRRQAWMLHRSWTSRGETVCLKWIPANEETPDVASLLLTAANSPCFGRQGKQSSEKKNKTKNALFAIFWIYRMQPETKKKHLIRLFWNINLILSNSLPQSSVIFDTNYLQSPLSHVSDKDVVHRCSAVPAS